MLNRILDFSKAYELFQVFFGTKKLMSVYINTYLKPAAGMKVLDLGCGPGRTATYLKNVDYLGIDMNSRYIEQANNKYGGDNIKFECADVAAIKGKKAGKYDIVMMNGVLHHIDDEKAGEVLASVKTLLKPDGRFCSFDNVIRNEASFIEKFLIKNDRGKFVRTPEEYAKIVRKYLPNAKYEVKTGLINLPYSHIFFY